MYLVYLDEVKHDSMREPYYWLCGLAVPEEDIAEVETCLGTIAGEYFGSSLIDVSTEFHATSIIQGKCAFKGHNVARRLALIKRLSDVISKHPNLGRIVIRLNPAKMDPKNCQSVAFMFIVERVNQLMCTRKSHALLIADRDEQFVGVNVRNLSQYKATGTNFPYGQQIKNVVDTVHHTCSHHSRLIQLADVYAYSVALCSKTGLTHLRKDFSSYARKLDNFLFPTKYKYWPPE